MERDTNTTRKNSLIASLRQKVQEKEGEIEELLRLIEEKKRKFGERKNQIQDEGPKINKVGGDLENMNITGIIENIIPNINPGRSEINKGEVDELRQEVVGSYS